MRGPASPLALFCSSRSAIISGDTTNHMNRTIIFLSCVAALFAQPHSQSRHLRQFGGKTGLVLIASARDGWAVATDGAQVNADGTISRAEKLFRIGKDGAVAIAGSVSIQDPVGRPVREELDVPEIVRTWINSHPEASLDSAIREITEQVSGDASKFFSARDPGKHAGEHSFTLIFVGYANQKPVITGTRYFAPVAKGKPPRVERITVSADPGLVFVFGPGAVAAELLDGNSPSLKKFKASSAIANYKASSPKSLTAEQFSAVLATILDATESATGKALSGKNTVAAPNKVVTITFALK